MSFDSSVITGQIENFIQSAKKLEADLDAERKRSHKIAVEYVDVRGQLEKAVKVLQSQLQQRDQKLKASDLQISERDQTIQQLNQSLETQRQTESALHQRNAETAELERKTRTELTRYQKAWSQVQAREAEARKILPELEAARKSLLEQRDHIDQLKQHAQTYRRELETSQARVQTLEGQLKQLHQEYQKMAQGKKAVETIALGLKDELNLERERAKQEHGERIEELTRRSTQDLQKLQAMEHENTELKVRIRTLQGMMHAEGERLRQQVQQLTRSSEVSIDKAERFETVNIRNQQTIGELRKRVDEQECSLNLLRLEKSQLQAAQESVRKNLNKQLMVDRLRFEAEIERLTSLIENLERADIRVQCIDSDEIDGEILMAYPVPEARSSPPELSN